MSSVPSAGPSGPERPARGLCGLVERGLLPDAAFRFMVRRFCAKRLSTERSGETAATDGARQREIDAFGQAELTVRASPLLGPLRDVPPRFFRHCLGPRLASAGCYYPSGQETLAQAEDAMLELCGARAELDDHQAILELGCGWGALTLWMARRFPHARITAVTDCMAQYDYIRGCCEREGRRNVQVVHGGVAGFDAIPGSFDRVVTVELLDRVSSYRVLLARIARWLRPGGKCFAHFVAHRTLSYAPVVPAHGGWARRHGFTGGAVPSVDAPLWFQDDLHVERRWLIDGTHYQRTANHWLANQDAARDAVMAVLRDLHGDAAGLWYRRWRMVWMMLAERFGYADGAEWMAVHYRFARPESWEHSLIGRF
ncbi:class I SAM-dependent methyltransferase [Luteibacter sp. PPL201]|uniref:Class I SAM-dependent methyltransferase n=1 Tax=Luteibacter sahnii TaxID=3021977 RepID=A0ABT6B8W0_9GAMM|nr:class I SAM-dependent methyltransferase [Luteibacter sp. PPL193]MDY1549417.1 class I SAM-dependent methyltransferase [Luteibacter sp. PPL193]